MEDLILNLCDEVLIFGIATSVLQSEAIFNLGHENLILVTLRQTDELDVGILEATDTLRDTAVTETSLPKDWPRNAGVQM